jgi:acetylornithine deacetylase
VPAEATATLDVRTTPALTREEIVARVRGAVRGEVRVLSDRLLPKETPADALLVDAARKARPEARLFGSATLSDMVFLNGTPAVKCGPGKTERSHTPDEYVLESEILDGARFYTRLIGAYAERRGPHPLAPSSEQGSNPGSLARPGINAGATRAAPGKPALRRGLA